MSAHGGCVCPCRRCRLLAAAYASLDVLAGDTSTFDELEVALDVLAGVGGTLYRAGVARDPAT